MSEQLQHHGIKGMRWGVRRFQKEDGTLTSAGKHRYAEESDKHIKQNKDGSKTIPKDFVFNRVGKMSLDINQSGALYVSHGKADAARYIKALGPTPMGKLFGTASEAVQHIKAKSDLRMPSNEQVAVETANLLLSNKKLFRSFSESFYSVSATGDMDRDITPADVRKAITDPNGKSAQKLAYAVSSFLGDGNYADDSKIVYAHFRKKGFDVIPDLHDRLSGTSETAMIVINPQKVKMTSSTLITKEAMRDAKAYVKSLGKLKVSDLIDD